MVVAATQAMKDALALEQFAEMDAERRVAVDAKEQEAHAAREAARAEIEAQISRQQESLRQLQESLAAQ